MSKDKKVLHKDIEWGNIELPNLSDEELFDPYINVKIRNKSDEKVALNSAITKSSWTDEKRKQQSKKLKAHHAKHGNLHPNDYVVSDQTKQKISKKLKGRTLSPEHVEKLKIPCSEENKAKKSAKLKAYYSDPKNKITCVHCGQLSGKTNHSKFHGETCWLKDKVIVAYIDEKVLFRFDNQIDLQTKHALVQVKNAIKDNKKYHKMFWKLLPKNVVM
jgi:hypothetical protein